MLTTIFIRVELRLAREGKVRAETEAQLVHEAKVLAKTEALLAHEAKALAEQERNEARSAKEKLIEELECKLVLIAEFISHEEHV